MAKQLLPAALLIGVIAVWIVWFSGSEGDPLARRDTLMAGPVVVEYEPGPDLRPGAPDAPWTPWPARWALLDGDGWIYRQLAPDFTAVMVFNGAEAFRAVDERAGCFASVAPNASTGDLENIPGIAYASTLLSGMKVERDGPEVVYEHEDARGLAMLVTEDLSRVNEGIVHTEVRSRATDGLLSIYTIRRLEADALAQARATVDGAAAVPPGEQGRLLVDFRVSGMPDPDLAGPAAIPVLPGCPGAMLAQLFAPLGLEQRPDGSWLLTNAMVLDLPFDAPDDQLEAAARDGLLRDVPLRPGLVFAVIDPPARAATYVFRVVACEGADWFRC
jgi:hypothetical protein